MTYFLRVLICAVCISFQLSYAQGTRYLDEVFDSVKVTKDVVYGSNIPFGSTTPIDLKMDIYEPHNDSETKRPVIILCHAGSFLSPEVIAIFSPLKPLGTREDNWLVGAAKAFAKRGYVVVSMGYRVGWNPQAQTQEARARSIMQAVWRGQQDFRACVRYFRKNATQYKINPDRIAGGGSSSGAYLPIHAATLDHPSELSLPKFLDSQGVSFIDTVALGSFEGVSGNPGYSSDINVILSFGGAVGDTVAMEAGDPTVIAVHGVNDGSTPYGTATVVTSVGAAPIIEVSGSRDYVRRSKNLGNQKILIDNGFNDSPSPGLKPFYGVGFEPYSWWTVSSQGRVDSGKVYLDSLVKFVAPRLKTALVDAAVSRDKMNDDLKCLRVFPNPVKNLLYFALPIENGYITSIEVFDLVGRSVRQVAVPNRNDYQIDVSSLKPGIYFLKVKSPNGEATRKITVE